MRTAIAVIYAFARTADNYADNTIMQPAEKLTKLNNLETSLINIGTEPYKLSELSCKNDCCNTAYQRQNTANPLLQQDENILLALGDIIQKYNLPLTLLLDLLTAFKQDVTKNRYRDFSEILNYCRYSANPIGKLLLHLAKQDTAKNLEYSDNICTSLQLINFMQDLYFDLTKLDHCYIPLEDLNKFKVSIEELKSFKPSAKIELLLKHQLNRIYDIFNKGSPLGAQLKGFFGFEIRLIIEGGKQILQKLTHREHYYQRPILCFKNKVQMLHTALFTNSFSITTPMTAAK